MQSSSVSNVITMPNALMQADREFVDILASIRAGGCSPEGSTVRQLQGCCGPSLYTLAHMPNTFRKEKEKPVLFGVKSGASKQ